MTDKQKFGTAVFGGFDKKNVIEYIANMLDKFNCEIESIKRDYEIQLNEKDSLISHLKFKYKASLVKTQALKNKISSNENSYKEIIAEKENIICKLNEQVHRMKNELNCLKNEDRKIEDKIKQAEIVVKSRVNRIMRLAKNKIEQKYRENIELANTEVKFLQKKAREEASRILRNASNKAYEIAVNSREETQKLIDSAQLKADGIIAVANAVVEKILKDNAKSVIEGVKNSNIDEVNITFDANFLKEQIDEEVLNIIKKVYMTDCKNRNICEETTNIKKPFKDLAKDILEQKDVN